MSSLYPTIRVEVELAGAGNGWTDLTRDVFPGLEITHGMSGGGPTDLVAGAGRCLFELNNAETNSALTLGYYSRFHASKRPGWELNIACRVRITDPATLTVHTRFLGRLVSIEPVPGVVGSRRVAVEAVTWLDVAATWAITADLAPQEGQRGDQLVANLVAQMPSAPPAVSYDTGADAYPYAVDRGRVEETKALQEFARIAQSGFDRMYEKADGTLRFESRHARLLLTTVAWTIPASDLTRDGLTMPSSRDAVLNTFSITAHPKIVDVAATSVVYAQTNTIEIAAGTTVTLLGPYRDQASGDPIGATDIQTQIAGTDYVGASESGGGGTDLTSDLSIVVTAGANGVRFAVSNTGASLIYLTTLQLRGKRVMDRATDTRKATDATSVTTYGERSVAIDLPYQASGEVAQGAAEFLRDGYKDPLAHAQTITVLGKRSDLITQILTRDISDRVAVSEALTGLDHQFFINGVTLRVLKGPILEAEYVLAPAIDPSSGTYFVIDTDSLDGPNILAPF